jgi:hypothetical protein
MEVIGGDATTSVKIGNMVVGANGMKSVALNGSAFLTAEGTGQVFLTGSEDGGGTFSDTIVNVQCWENADDAVLRLTNQNGVSKEANLIFDGSSDLILTNTVAAKDIDLKVLTTGQVEVANQTTDTDTVLSVMGNGTGAPRLDLQNASKRVWIECQANKKLTVQGGSGGDTFVFDVSSASGGIQFPDSTIQTTAASGGGDGMLFCAAPPASGYDYDLSGQSQGSQGSNPTFTSDEMYLMPFSVPTAISAVSLKFGLTVTTGAWNGTFYAAIYTADANNLPSTLVGSANASITTAGDKTLTFASPLSLSADTLYYASISWDSTSGNCGYNGGYYEYGRSGMPIDNTTAISTNSVGVLKYAIAIPPATLTTASITGQVVGGPKIRMGV